MARRFGSTFATAALTALVLASLLVPRAAAAADVVVFAAASLKNAVDAVDEAFAQETGKSAVASFAASSALARQIEEGAPADIFISADLAWMDHVDEKGLVRPETRANLLGNRIALVASSESDLSLKVAPGFDLARALGDGRLAVGETSAVPAGKYAKAALEALGVWTSVADHLAEAENVRAALLLVSRGEAPLGIVYQTDAAADPGVRIVDLFPTDTHPPIVYPVAVVASSANPDAASYLDFLKSEKAAAIFEAAGFTVLGDVKTN